MILHHKGLTIERWSKFSLIEQLANIGSEIERTINWKTKFDDPACSKRAFERALELIDLTIADPKNRKRLKEVVRSRELLVDHFVYDNLYNTTDESWRKYFYGFSYAAALQRGL
ncbi:hypothetical protein KAT92_04055 [Candidatus Babeliales bacterium]|nr:hypothetical protein [Candidatus Babeliales bacterium]